MRLKFWHLSTGKRFSAVALGYAILGGIGLALAIPPGYASPVFPASGFALAALLRFGIGAAPAVWLGSLVLNSVLALIQGRFGLSSVMVAAAIGIGASLQAMAGWALLRKAWHAGGDLLESEREIIRFLLLGGPVACGISASFGIGTLLAFGIIAAPEFSYAWWNWYIGDTLGVLLFAPLTVALFRRRDAAWVDRSRVLSVVMPAVLLVAATAFYVSSRWEVRQQQAELASRGDALADVLESTLIAHREALASLARFVEVTREVRAEQFRHFASGILDEHPEIFALSFNPLVSDSQRRAFEARMSQSGEPFGITERGAEGTLVAAGRRSEYVAVAHIAPLEGNRKALGFDINSEPLRRDAVSRARATRDAAATAPLVLVQDRRNHTGLLALMPTVSRRGAGEADRNEGALTGFAVAVIKVDAMVARALAGSLSPDLALRLSDPEVVSGEAVLYESAESGEIAQVPESMRWHTNLEMMDRTWRLEVMPTPRYLAAHRPWVAWGVGVVCLLLATLVQMLILGMLGRTATIRRRVDEQTLELSTKSRALEASEERLRMTLENTPNVAVQWIDSGRGRIVYWNSAAEALFGWRASEAIGKPPCELFVDVDIDHDRCEQAIGEARDGTRSSPRECRLPTRDGRRIWVVSTLFAIAGNDGGAPIVVRMDVDITERKAGEARLADYQRELEALVESRTADLVRTEARASAILNSSADGLFGLDLDGRIVFVNEAACQMLGYRQQDLLGADAHARLHHSHADGSVYPRAQSPIVSALAGGEGARVDGEVFWRADGQPIPIMYAVHPLRSARDADGVVVSFVDMSAQRAIAQAKERALLEAETLARMRSEFLANMSHEIRTPLHGVLGFAGIGLRRIDNKEKVREAFVKIRTAGEHLLGVINDILDFSSLDAGKLKIAAIPTSPGREMDAAIEVLYAHAVDKGIYLRGSKGRALPKSCLSDPLRIKQILINLISNAVKFTLHGGVDVQADVDGGELVFRVADTGIGIAPERMQSIFSPFEQVDGSSTRTAGGTGLGLTITKRLIDRMRGTLTLDSEPGGGSTFEVRLPLVADPDDTPLAEPDELRSAPEDRPLEGLRLLVAEDAEVNRMILADDLEFMGATVCLVGDGRAAVEAVRNYGEQYFDAVLMDIQMPVMDGFEATVAIHELAPGLPVIAQTAHAFQQELARCVAAGMVGHVSKPIDNASLAQAITHCLARA